MCRSFFGFSYLSEVFAVYDELRIDSLYSSAANPKPSGEGLGFSGSAVNPKPSAEGLGFRERLSGCRWGVQAAAGVLPPHAFRGFLYFNPFRPLLLSYSFANPKTHANPNQVSLATAHCAVHGELLPPKPFQARLLDLQEVPKP